MAGKIIRCRSCGAPVSSDAERCEFCGSAVKDMLAASSQEKKNGKASASSVGKRVVKALKSIAKPPYEAVCEGCKDDNCEECIKTPNYLIDNPQYKKWDSGTIDLFHKKELLARTYLDESGFKVLIRLTDSYMKAQSRNWKSKRNFVKSQHVMPTMVYDGTGMSSHFEYNLFDYECMSRSTDYADLAQIIDDFIDNVAGFQHSEVRVVKLKETREDILGEEVAKDTENGPWKEPPKVEVRNEPSLVAVVIRRAAVCLALLLIMIIHYYLTL